MKKWIMAIVCLMTMVLSANAQQASGFNYLDHQESSINDDTYITIKDKTPSVALAGSYLKKSANCEVIAIICAGASAGFAILGSDLDSKQHKRDYSGKQDYGVYYIASGVFGVASLVAYVAKIHYKWKSGKTLELCGNGVRLNF